MNTLNSSINILNQSDSDDKTSSDSDDEAITQDSVATSPGHEHNLRSPDEDTSRPSSSRVGSMRVAVHRAEINPTVVQEATDELHDLNVEAYDQQTYERGVFEQVDKAISVADDPSLKGNSSAPSHQSSNITDLIRIIHAQGDQQNEEEEACDPIRRDEQVLQLTRLQRLNKPVKIEREDPDEHYPESVRKLPKIPKLSATKNLQSSSAAAKSNKNATRISLKPSTSYETISVKREVLSDDEHTDSDTSQASEYKPPVDEVSTDEDCDNEDIDYETDSELDQAAVDDDDKRKSSRKRKQVQDDGDFKYYEARIKAFTRLKAKLKLDNILDDGTEFKKLDEMINIEGSLQIPKEMWDNLFEHQRTGVRWLWELHQLGTGGILGDEMGLGKTIQVIAFLTALRTSNVVNMHKGYDNLGPTVLVCPATVMHQWLIEFRKWWPPFRVAILHSTGSFSGNRKHLVQAINKSRGVLIVSYQGVVIYQDYLHSFDWHYAILDEGHKIRNPDAQVTLACKRFRTPHRIILSGSPVQNNLKELWSIFDFIYPGKLGTLPVFMEQFATPITQGGYANASDIQVQIAYKCACVLRDTIKPFLLRRTKAEVNNKLKLPERSEQVLFCKLTDKQRKLYQSYLSSPTVRDIKGGYCQIFVGLIQLRKICNHPDLFDSTECRNQIKQLQQAPERKLTEFSSVDETFGHYKKSGKMMVVEPLLKLWKQQNHKVLLFTQSRQMFKIFMSYLDERNYTYLSMDGATPIGVRQTMIEEFNKKDDIFIFLLTTRVGGVGVNLTGADRIIIYDPDWNPSTDIQARERAWRIGQKRHVIIYRLLTAGTIEEKIYHRQVFKLYLTNRVLKDAKQKRFFKTNDLHELFALGDNDKNIETKALFDDDLQINPETIKRSKIKSKSEKKKRKKRKHREEASSVDNTYAISVEKLQEMRDKAKRLSQMIAQQYGTHAASEVEQAGSNQVRVKVEPGCVAAEPEQHTLNHVRIKTEPGLSPVPVECPIAQPTKLQREQGNDSLIKHNRENSTKKRMNYLVKQDIYEPNKHDSEETSDPRYKRDDYILERLFKNSNISGALKHDKIETDSTSDFKVVESEAEKVARDAIRALRESRRMCLDSSFGIPNWTGRNGQVAEKPRLMPKNKSRVQLLGRVNNSSSTNASASSSSSSGSDSLLSSIKKRNQNNPIAIAHRTFHGPTESDDEQDRDKDFVGTAQDTGAEGMADKIREFLLFGSARNGEAQTDELLEFFKITFKPDKTAIFKAILYKMCDFQKRGSKGFWSIKTEFRDL